MILNGQRNVAAQQIECVEFAVFIERIPGTAAQGDHSRQSSSGFQRGEAFEEFGRDIAIGTQEHRIRGRIKNDRATRRGECMDMFGKERNEGGIGHQGESLCHALARSCRFHDGRQHEPRGFRELAFRR